MSDDEDEVPPFVGAGFESPGTKDEEYDFGVADVPEEFEFDYRSPDVHDAGPNPSLHQLVDHYLGDAAAPLVVRHHIPNLLTLLCTKIADRRNLIQPVHFYGPGIPFRYRLHSTLIGSSGSGKGATVAQFYALLGRTQGGPALFPTFTFTGGSVESMRGGVTQDRPNDPRLVKPGSLERMDFGFLHIPEMTQVVDLSQKAGGGAAVKSLLAWADTGEMTYETISGREVHYASGATLLNGLQTGALNEVATAVAGWARRTEYDWFTAMSIEEMLPENRPEATEGDPALFAEIRSTIMGLVKSYAPSRVDWSPFRRWLGDAYKNHLATIQDEQMLYAVALGHHLATGGSVVGDVTISVSPSLHAVFERLLFNKRLTRISAVRRLSFEVMDVLEDPYVMGSGQKLRDTEVYRIVAPRVSVPEDEIAKAIAHIIDRGLLLSTAEKGKGGGAGQNILRLRKQ